MHWTNLFEVQTCNFQCHTYQTFFKISVRVWNYAQHTCKNPDFLTFWYNTALGKVTVCQLMLNTSVLYILKSNSNNSEQIIGIWSTLVEHINQYSNASSLNVHRDLLSPVFILIKLELALLQMPWFLNLEQCFIV